MDTPKARKSISENGDKLTTAVRLGQIEVQLGYLTDSIKSLGIQIERTETTRSASLLEYVQAHSKIVADCKDNTEDLQSLRTEYEASLIDAAQSFTVINKKISDWGEKINPLLTAHKILVWVAIFFASSIGLLLWGIFTHTVSLIYTK
jgi:hypothetical protein